ncbi:MAG TPA: glycerophosphodiester phosphodiesterase family protein [Rectinemataceae bacterium]|nr:glycerophosphodiester phosphodiesterase family protein [Rectinemataceae bacterium]
MTSEGMAGIGGVVFWQAHRGGGGVERPDNTMISALYGWSLGGAAELDIRLTADGKIVCLHDPTLRRTTNAPESIADVPVTELRYEQFAELDTGAKFDLKFAGARVPLLTEVFAAMAADPKKRAYLDCKNIDLGQLARMIADYGLDGRIWVAGPKRADLAEMRKILPSVDTMQWLGGTGAEIVAKYEDSAAAGFQGLAQIQFHLNDRADAAERPSSGWRYTVEPRVLADALARCGDAGVDLEVFPWKFAEADIWALLDLGVRWFATDEPARFSAAVEAWLKAGERR